MKALDNAHTIYLEYMTVLHGYYDDIGTPKKQLQNCECKNLRSNF